MRNVPISATDARYHVTYFHRQHCPQRKAPVRAYISYSEADFEVFHPAGATHCTDAGEI